MRLQYAGLAWQLATPTLQDTYSIGALKIRMSFVIAHFSCNKEPQNSIGVDLGLHVDPTLTSSGRPWDGTFSQLSVCWDLDRVWSSRAQEVATVVVTIMKTITCSIQRSWSSVVAKVY